MFKIGILAKNKTSLTQMMRVISENYLNEDAMTVYERCVSIQIIREPTDDVVEYRGVTVTSVENLMGYRFDQVIYEPSIFDDKTNEEIQTIVSLMWQMTICSKVPRDFDELLLQTWDW